MKIFTKFLYLSLLSYCFLIPFIASGQTADLQFVPELDCPNGQVSVRMQIQAQDANMFRLGTSSLLFTYNNAAVQFASYTSLNFDGSDNCIAGVASAWDPHSFDGTSVAGTFNVTMVLNNEGFGCPDITNTDWVDIGRVTFTILDGNLDPTFAYDVTNTNFNVDNPNDGSVTVGKGNFANLSGNILNCASNAPPSANPQATPTSGTAPLKVLFDATGSTDSDGALVAYSWDFGDGSTSTSDTVSYTYTTPGNYAVQLIVTDDSAASDTATLNIVVNAAPNIDPIAVATATPDSGDAPLKVFFDATGSTDPDGTINAYAWDFDGLGTATSDTASFVFATPGTYTVQLIVTDDSSATDTTTVTVQVDAPVSLNQAPTAVATASPDTGDAPLKVFFDATGSTDPDGTINAYAWDFDGLGTATSDTASFVFATPGTYTVQLIVTDDSSATDTTTVTVQVDAPVSLNQAPTAVATASPDTGIAPLKVFFDATGSTDPDGTINAYAWDFDGLGTATSDTASFVFATPGTYTVQLIVTDDSSATDTTTVAVQVDAPVSLNQAPTAVATASPDTGIAPLKVFFDATGSTDPDGTINAYAWDFDGLGTATSDTASFVFATPGTYTVQLIVTDDSSATDTTTLTVQVDANQPPKPSFLATPLSGPAPLFVFFDAAASNDPDGTIVSYQWNFGDTGIGTGDTTSHTYTADGVYTAQLIVTDDLGASDTTSVDITVATPNNLPVAQYTTDTLAGEAPVKIFFDGTASVDSGGSIISYEWIFGDGGTATGDTVSYTYLNGGIYFPQLVVTDNQGATDTTSKVLFVQNPGDTASADLRFVDSLNCQNGTFTATIQIRSSNAKFFKIGTSSVLFNYNPAALQFVSYTSRSFDGSDLCIGGVASAWDAHSFDGTSVAGAFNMTLVLNNEGFGCPEVNGLDWIDVGQVQFSVLDSTVDPNLVFDAINTSFNVDQPNDGSVQVGNGNFQSLTGNILSCPDNALPSASFIATPDTGFAPLVVAFDATASADSDGVILSYVWDFGDGNSGSGSTISNTYLTAGTYSARLIVTDDGGATDTTFATILVNAGSNQAPIANAIATPDSGSAPLTVRMNATSSVDPDGTIVNYAWDFGDGSTGTGDTLTHVFDSAGVFTVQLVVTDDSAATDTFTLAIQVTGSALLPPVAVLNLTDSTGNAPFAIGFDATNSYDSAGVITSYEWDFGDAVQDTGSTAVHTYLAPGTYLAQLIVVSSTGLRDTATAIVTINPGNLSPVAAFTATPDSGDAPLVVSFDATASSDSNGTLVYYGWDFGNGNTATGVTATDTFFEAGTYTVQLFVRDNAGAMDTATTTITVQPLADTIPIADLRFVDSLDCVNDTLWATMQIRAANTQSFRLGTSSVLFTYNDSALQFVDYQSLNFDGTGLCISGVASAWDAHAFDGVSVPGSFNLTMVLNNEGFGCPDILGTDWVSIGRVAFVVSDSTLSPDLAYDTTNTNFNVDQPNDGSITVGKGIFAGLSGNILDCPQNIAPVAAFTPLPDTGLVPLAVAFDASASFDEDGSIVAYDWDFGDGSVGTGRTAINTYILAGTYSATLVVTDNVGAADTLSIAIVVRGGNERPIAAFTNTPDTGNAPVFIGFDASSSSDPDGSIVSYLWDFGNGRLDTGMVVSDTFRSAGYYTVSLVVVDDLGARDTATTQLVIQPPFGTDSVADLRFADTLDCGNGTFTATVQIRSANTQNFKIGTSSLLFTYNDSALQFVGYESYTFDGSDNCISGVAPAWDLHAFDGTTIPGAFNLTMVLNNEGFGCPEINGLDWVSIGKVSFAVLDSTLSPDLVFDTTNTNFNVDQPNDGSVVVNKGNFQALTGPVLLCPDNTAPLAAFVATPTTGDAPLLVNFNAGTSSDSDGTIVSYEWDFGDGTLGTGLTTTHTYTTLGNYTAQLIITDDLGLRDTAIVAISVNGNNVAPSAFFTFSPDSVNAPAQISFDATGTTDADGSIVSYSWNFGDGTIGAGDTTQHTFSLAGRYPVQLVVTDDGGLRDTLVNTVTILPPVGTEPIADMRFVDSLDCGTNTFSATIQIRAANTFNYKIGTSSILFSYNDSALQFSSYESLTFDGSDLCIGGVANAWDPHATDGTSVPGAFNLTMVLNNEGFGCPEINGLDWVSIGRVNFTVIDSTLSPDLVFDTTNTNFNVDQPNDGSVTVGKGNFAALTGVSLACSGPQGPVAAFTPTPNTGPFPLTVNFDATASQDADGSIVSYEWDFGDGNSGIGVIANNQYTTEGTYTARLVVTDNEGNTDSASAVINVLGQPGSEPIADLRFVDSLDCDNKILIAKIQIRADELQNFKIGTSSILVTYNDSALSYNSYNSRRFNGTDLCIGGVASAWDPHVVDGVTPGLFNLTMVLNNEGFGCPPITDADWIDIGEIRFDIQNATLDPRVAFDTTNTSFNIDLPNDGTVSVDIDSTFGLNGSSILVCPGNLTPTAVIVADPLAGPPPLIVDFDGTTSVDADGTILSYTWDFGDSTGTTGPLVSKAYTEEGTFTVSLIVGDDQGAFDTATVDIVVSALNIAPLANFTVSPLTGNAPLQVNFDATASVDADGTIVSYAWNFGDNTTASGVTTTKTYNQAGNYTATLIVTDNDGAMDTSLVTLAVGEPNDLPIASFVFNPTTGEAPLAVTFNASASNDPDGTIESYEWNFGDGGNGNGRVTTYNFNRGGTFTVNLVVTDNRGEVGTVSRQITIMPGNQLPVARFTPTPIAGEAPLAVSFNGSASSDPDGNIVSYAWNFGDGTTATGANANHTYSAAGTFVSTLTVTDNDGATGVASVVITVNAANMPPVASITANPIIGDAPLGVDFNGTNSSDPDGTVVGYNWDFGDGNSATGSIVNHTYAAAGSYTAILTVTDEDGATDTAQVAITVNVANQAPVALFTPTPTTGDAPLLVSFDAAASNDPDGMIVSYAWDFGDGNTGTGVNPTHTYLAAGTYAAMLTVTDEDMATNTVSVNIVVNAANMPPVAAFTPTPPAGVAPLAVSFNAGASTDPDGTIQSFAWSFGDGTVATGQIANHTYPAAGNYTATLIVTDDAGASDTATAVIVVNPPLNRAPNALFTANPTTGNAPLKVFFDATGSTDPDGSIVNYAWNFGDTNTGAGDTTSHVFAAAGTYPVQLIITDDSSATDTFTIDIVVNINNILPDAQVIANPVVGTAPLKVFFDATGSSDADGTIVSYAWNFGDTNTGTGDTTSHVFTNAGTYRVLLTVTDDSLATDTVSVDIVVNGVNNIGPIATFIATPTTGNAPLKVFFDATGSTDSDGTIVSYAWTFGDTNTGTGDTTSHIFTTPGTYPVQLIVTDDSAATDTFSVDIVVNGLNNVGPIATFIATPPTGDAPLKVFFDATGSSDADGTIVSYAWNFGDTNTGTGDTTSHIFTTPGTYPVQLIVTDDSAATDTFSVDIVVNGLNNVGPIATFIATPTTGNAPLKVFFDATGSTDPDGSIVNYAWNFGDTNTGAGDTTSHIFAAAGTYPVQLIITDDSSATDTFTIDIVVNINNILPDAQVIANPVVGTAPLKVFFDATGSSDADGTIVNYAWNFGDTNTGTGDTTSHVFTNAGTYRVLLTVTDDSLATDTVSVDIVVNGLNNVGPIATFIATPTTGDAPLKVFFDATGSSDADGTIVSYAWNFGDTNIGTGDTTSHIFTTPGTYPVQLIVTDDSAATDTFSVDIVVNGLNNVGPIATFIATPTTGNAPLKVFFDATGSTDSDGTIVSYAWNFGDTNTGTGDTTSYVYPNPGTYTVQLIVTDDSAATDTFSVDIVVNQGVNTPPVAQVIASPTTGNAPLKVFFDATGSSDADGTILSYAWNFGDSNVGAGDTTSHVYGSAGTYTAQLIITDDGGASDTATVEITVQPAIGNSPIADLRFVDTLDCGTNSFTATLQIRAANTESFKLGTSSILLSYNDTALQFSDYQSFSFDGSDLCIGGVASAWDAHAFDGASVPGTFNLTMVLNNEGFGCPEVSGTEWVSIGQVSFTILDGSLDPRLAYDTLNTNFNVDQPNDGTVTVGKGNFAGLSGLDLLNCSGNLPPIAQFTADPTAGNAPLTVTFNATGSSDADGTIVDYAWNFGDGFSGNGAAIAHTYTAAGSYLAELIVTDDSAATDTFTVAITVGSDNVGPIATFIATPTTGDAPLKVFFDATGSSDADGTVVSYAWNFGDTNIGTGDTTSHIFTTPGTYPVQLIVTDDSAATDTFSVDIVVNGLNNVGPIATFIATPTTGNAPLKVFFDATGSTDSDGTIVSYAWNFGDTNTGTGDTTSYVYPNPGTYTVQLIVTDDSAATDTFSVDIVVNQGVNTPPVAQVIASPTTGNAPLKVFFDATGSSDADGTILSYAWNFGDSNVGAGDTTSHVYGSAGTYTAQLIITDDGGASDTATVEITVQPAIGNSPIADLRFVDTLDCGTNSFTATLQIRAANTENFKLGTSSILLSYNDTALQFSDYQSFSFDGSDLCIGGVASAWDAHAFDGASVPGTFNLTMVLNNEGFGCPEVSGTEWVSIGQVSFTILDGSLDPRLAYDTLNTNFNVDQPNDGTVTVGKGNFAGLSGLDLLNCSGNLPPIAQFTADPTAGNAPLTVTFNATGSSDADGTIVDYAWNFGDGFSGNGAAIAHTYTAAGSYLAELIVTDDSAATDTFTVAITVGSDNVGPIATFIATPPTGDAPLKVFFDATGSSDADGTVVSYAWNFGDTNIGTGDTTSHIFTTPGTYPVQLIVTDDSAATDTFSVDIVVNGVGNTAPIAVFTADPTTGNAPLKVFFDATGSSDADGTIVSYAWNFGDTNTGTGDTTSHIFTTPGTYPVQLIVTDDSAATDTFSVDIVVNGVGNTAPIAVFTADPTTGNAPLKVFFDATGSSDADGTIVNYAWNFGDTNTGTGDTTSYVYPNPGTYTVQLIVTDDSAATDTFSVDIVVNGLNNVGPIATFIATPPTGDAPLKVFFDATGSTDSDGTIVSYAWNFGDTNTGTGDTTSYVYPNPGTYTVQLIVTDDSAATDTFSVDIVVNGLNNIGPIATFIATPTTGDAPLKVFFDATGSSDADGTIVNYAWNFGDTNTGTGDTTSHIFTTPGTYPVQLIVTDDSAATDTFSVDIVVNGLNNVGPIATFIATPTTGNAPLKVFFDATGSTDSDGTIVSYAWTFGDTNTGTGDTTSYVYPNPGTYTVQLIVTDDSAATDTFSVDIVVLEGSNTPPVAQFTADPITGNAPLLVTVDANASSDPDGTLVSYSWDFGDGSIGNGVNAVHTYTSAGLYMIRLIITDDGGASDTAFTQIEVLPVIGTERIADLRLIDSLDCETNQFITTIQIRAANIQSFNLGTSSILFNYNDQALQFQGYQSISFNGSDLCIGGVASAWDEHAFDGVSVPGIFNLTLVLNNEGFGCPEVNGTEWVSVGQVSFSILDNALDPNLDFDIENTNFNVDQPNDGTVSIGKGTFSGLEGNTLLNCQGNLPPIAQFTADPVAGTPPLLVTFDANGSRDADGTIVSYTWNFGDGNVGTGVALTHTYQEEGIYTATLVVTDDSAAMDTFRVDIAVTSQNLPPIASFTADPVTGAAPLKVFLDAKGSSDLDGLIVSYVWDFGDTNSGTGDTTSHVFATPGTYPVQLIVTDDSAATDTIVVDIVVTAPENLAPIAQFTVDPQLGNAPLKVFFDANGSSDPDGNLVNYSWSFGDGAIGSGDTTTYVFGTPGIYTVQLIVTDDSAAMDTFSVDITVLPDSNQAPLAQFIADPTNGTAPLRVEFDATSSSDIDGVITSYSWDFGDGTSGLGDTISHVFTNAGIYAVKLIITDDSAATDTATVFIVVNEGKNEPPIAAFTADPTTGNAPLLVNVDANGSADADGALISYAWDFGDGTAASGVTASHSYASAGTYTVRLIVTDNGGASDTTTAVITVEPALGTDAIADLRLIDSLDCNTGIFKTIIQIRSANIQNFKLGTSSILLTYNDSALQYNGYTSLAFDGSTQCIGGVASAWDVHAFDGTSVPGIFNLTLVLNNEGFGCPEVNGIDWISIGEVSFAVQEGDLDPRMAFDTGNTNFNVDDPNDGTVTIGKGTFTGLQGSALLNCGGNLPPVAQFMADPLAGGPPLEVTFDANGSSDPDGVIVTYIWDFGDGASGNGVAITHTYANEGSYEAKLIVVDDEGARDTMTVGIFVSNGNLPPIAMFTADPQIGEAPLDVAFDASESRDIDGEIINYQWDFGDGLFGEGVIPQHIYATAGTYTATLIVTDDSGAKDTASVSITVNPPEENILPIASFMADPVVGDAPLNVSFDASLSSDPDGQLVSYQWVFGDGSTGEGVNATHTYEEGGDYTVSLIVTDNKGGKDTASTTITVIDVGTGPVADLRFVTDQECDSLTLNATLQIRARTLQSFYLGTSSVLVNYNPEALGFEGYTSLNFDGSDLCIEGVASAWDEHAFDGISVPGLFNLTMVLKSEAFGCPKIDSLDWVNIGSISFRIKNPAVDPALEFDRDNTNFNVDDPNDGTVVVGKGDFAPAELTPCEGNQRPEAIIIANPDSGSAPLIVGFSGSNSQDPDGEIVSYLWDFGDGTTDTSANPVHTYEAIGEYIATLIVTDNEGAMDTAGVLINVTLPGTDPIASLQMLGELDCETQTYRVTVQIQAETATSFNLGDSKINIAYNTLAMDLTGYTSVDFNENTTCLDSTTTPWKPHDVSASEILGQVAIGLELNDPGASCPIISNSEWLSIGTLEFQILDTAMLAGLRFDSLTTTFNLSSPNDGSARVPLGTLFGLEDAALNCVDEKFPPVAIITTDSAITSGDAPFTLGFSASESTDPDSNIVSYLWDFGMGDTAYVSVIDTAYTFLLPGTYTVTLIVIDADGLSDTAQVVITVGNGDNNPPIILCNVSPDSGVTPINILFDATQSFDPDGDELTFLWEFGDGTVGEGSLVNHVYTTHGEITVKLTVTDGRGGVSVHEKTLTLFPPSFESPGDTLDVQTFSLQWDVFPNPVEDLTVVRLRDIGEVTELDIEVHDHNGKLIMMETVTKLNQVLDHTLDLGSLSSGIYILTIRTVNSISSRHIIVK